MAQDDLSEHHINVQSFSYFKLFSCRGRIYNLVVWAQKNVKLLKPTEMSSLVGKELVESTHIVMCNMVDEAYCLLVGIYQKMYRKIKLAEHKGWFDSEFMFYEK